MSSLVTESPEKVRPDDPDFNRSPGHMVNHHTPSHVIHHPEMKSTTPPRTPPHSQNESTARIPINRRAAVLSRRERVEEHHSIPGPSPLVSSPSAHSPQQSTDRGRSHQRTPYPFNAPRAPTPPPRTSLVHSPSASTEDGNFENEIANLRRQEEHNHHEVKARIMELEQRAYIQRTMNAINASRLRENAAGHHSPPRPVLRRLNSPPFEDRLPGGGVATPRRHARFAQRPPDIIRNQHGHHHHEEEAELQARQRIHDRYVNDALNGTNQERAQRGEPILSLNPPPLGRRNDNNGVTDRPTGRRPRRGRGYTRRGREYNTTTLKF